MATKTRLPIFLTLLTSLAAFAVAGVINTEKIEPPQALTIRDNDVRGMSAQLSVSGSLVPADTNAPKVAIAVAAIGASAHITKAVCKSGTVAGCVAAGVTALLGNFFLAFKAFGKRDSTDHWILDYPSLTGYSTIHQLHDNEPEGGWRLIGNATVQGLFHDLHYYRNGSIAGLRALPYKTNGLSKRLEKDYGGVVVDYHWNDGNHVAYDHFGNNPGYIDGTANLWSQQLENIDQNIECASWYDDAGLLNSGVLTVGWHDKPWQFAPGQPAGYLANCEGKLQGMVPKEDKCKQEYVHLTPTRSRESETDAAYLVVIAMSMVNTVIVFVIAEATLTLTVQASAKT